MLVGYYGEKLNKILSMDESEKPYVRDMDKLSIAIHDALVEYLKNIISDRAIDVLLLKTSTTNSYGRPLIESYKNWFGKHKERVILRPREGVLALTTLQKLNLLRPYVLNAKQYLNSKGTLNTEYLMECTRDKLHRCFESSYTILQNRHPEQMEYVDNPKTISIGRFTNENNMLYAFVDFLGKSKNELRSMIVEELRKNDKKAETNKIDIGPLQIQKQLTSPLVYTRDFYEFNRK